MVGDFLNGLVESAGSYLLVGSVLLILVVALLIFLRATKGVIFGVALVALFGFTKSGFLPAWVMLVALIGIGLVIAKDIISKFLSTG